MGGRYMPALEAAFVVERPLALLGGQLPFKNWSQKAGPLHDPVRLAPGIELAAR